MECGALHLTRVGGLQMWRLRVGGAHLPELRFCASCLWGATPVTRATDNNKSCLGKAKGTLVAMATDVNQFGAKVLPAPSRPNHLAPITTTTIAPPPLLLVHTPGTWTAAASCFHLHLAPQGSVTWGVVELSVTAAAISQEHVLQDDLAEGAGRRSSEETLLELLPIKPGP